MSAAAHGPGAHASTHWSQGCLGEHMQLRIAPPSPEAPLRVPILAAKRLTGCCAPPGVRAASALRAASQRTQDLHKQNRGWEGCAQTAEVCGLGSSRFSCCWALG